MVMGLLRLGALDKSLIAFVLFSVSFSKAASRDSEDRWDEVGAPCWIPFTSSQVIPCEWDANLARFFLAGLLASVSYGQALLRCHVVVNV